MAIIVGKSKTIPSIVTGLLLALPVHIYHVNFIMPFFWIGYGPDVIKKHADIILFGSLAIFGCLWPFWDGYSTTYVTPLQLIKIQKMQWLRFGNLLPYPYAWLWE